MINYIKYGFGITIGVLLAKGVLSAVTDLYLSTVSKNERVMEGVKKALSKHVQNYYEKILLRLKSLEH